MTNDVKISLTINVAGSTRHCLGIKKIPYKVTKQDLTGVLLPKKIGEKIVKKGYAKSPSYVYENAQVHLNMYRCAYEYMISSEKPEHYYKKDWKRLNPKERLAWHMQFIASTYNSTDYKYNILED